MANTSECIFAHSLMRCLRASFLLLVAVVACGAASVSAAPGSGKVLKEETLQVKVTLSIPEQAEYGKVLKHRRVGKNVLEKEMKEDENGQKTDVDNLTFVTTADYPDCFLIRRADKWECDPEPKSATCGSKGLALTYKDARVGKSRPEKRDDGNNEITTETIGALGKLKVFRWSSTKRKLSPIMSFCAGNNVKMTKWGGKPTFFWAMDGGDKKHYLKIKNEATANYETVTETTRQKEMDTI